MRTKTVEPEKIILATIHIVAKDSLENLSTRKVSKESGVSDGCIFNYFKNKNDLLVQSLYHIDNELDKELSSVRVNVFSLKKSIRELWFVYFNFMTEHSDYAKFYRQFRHSSYYTQEVIDGQNKSFTFFTKFLKSKASALKIHADIFWVFVIETTLNFAVRVVDGQLPCEEKDKEKYFGLIANGMSGIIKSAADWGKDEL